MKKRLLRLLILFSVFLGGALAVFTFASLVPIYPILAEEVQDGGELSPNVTWNFDSKTGVLEIDGEGPIYSYANGTTPWYEYRGYIKSVEVDSGITSIPSGLFYNLPNLTEITLPFVGSRRVLNATQSKTMNFGFIFGTTSYAGGTYTAQDYATYSNYSAGINASRPTTKQSNERYYIPSSLTKVTITDATMLYYGAFQNCNNINEINLNEEIIRLDAYSFSGGHKLSVFTIPDSTEYIGNYTFNNCSSLEEVIIPDGVTVISPYTFNGCEKLKMVELPEGLITIEYNAFYDCRLLQEVNLPSTITSIGDSAFYNCSAVANINLPDGLTSIGVKTFYGMKKITSIVIPDSVQSIGDGAFSGWSGLTEITLPFVGSRRVLNATQSKTMNFGFIFGTTSYAGGTYTAQDYATYSNYSAGINASRPTTKQSNERYYIPSSLTKVTITDATMLYYGAFQNCNNINEINLNEEIIRLDAYSFSGATKLSVFTIPDSTEYIGNYTFNNCSSLEEVIIPDGVTVISPYTFNGCEKLKMVELPEGLITIEYNAFYDCRLLQEVNLPSTITSIGDSAFYNCSAVANINLPDGLTSIGVKTFYGMKKITSIVIPDSVQSIGDGAFSGWSGLTEITLPFVGSRRVLNATQSKTMNFGFIFGTTSYAGGTYTDQDYATYSNYSAGINASRPTTKQSNERYYIPSSLTKVTITDATMLYYGAFMNCRNINNLVLNDKIQRTDFQAFTNLGFANNTSDPFIISGNVLIRSNHNTENIAIPSGIGVIGPSAFCFPNSALNSDITRGYSNSTNTKNIVGGCPYLDIFRRLYAFYNLVNATIEIDKMAGHLAIDNYSFMNVSMVSYLDTNTYTNGNDTFHFNVSNTTASITKCVTTSLAITLPTSLGGYTVTSVGFKGMANCTTLTSVTIPYTIEELGEYSFYGCTGITTVTIPSTLHFIGDYSFAECTALTTVTIADGVEEIGNFAFSGCYNLTEIVIPDSCVYLGSYVFYNCTSLVSATIGISVEDINSHAFYNCTSLSTITIGTSVKTIGDYAFYNSSLSRLTTPPSLTSIGKYAFARNSLLSRVTLRPNLMYVGEGAFYYCVSLTSITLPVNVTEINDYTFAYCTNLATFEHLGEFTYIGSFAFIANPLSSFTFDDTVEYIGEAAFKNTQLVDIYLPDALTYLGADAFANCTSLKTVSIPDSVTHVGSFAFFNNNNLAATIRYNSGTVADEMFYNSPIRSVIIQEGITKIGKEVFRNSYYLSDVTLPDTLLEIGEGAYFRCFNLDYLRMSDKLTSIGINAFFDTDDIHIDIYSRRGFIEDYLFEGQHIYTIYIGNGVFDVGEMAFANCPYLISVSISDEVQTIGELCFFGVDDLHIYIRYVDGEIDDYVFKDCNTVTRFFIEDGIHTIGEYAFDSCKALERMDLPSSIQNIGSGAFYDCNSMTYINVPNGVKIINDHVFFGCASLITVELPNSYLSIEDYAFYGCISLEEIYISDYCTKIGSYAFYNCKSLISIDIKDSITSIGDYAFRSCGFLTEVTIPDSVTDLGVSAFYDCNGLTTVHLGKGIYELKDRLFYGCVNLNDLYLYAPQIYIDELAFYGAEDVLVHIGRDDYMESYFRNNGIDYVIDDSIIYVYKVSFYDEDGTLISSETYHYGDEIVVPDHPSKDADLTYTYTFSGWDSEVGTVTGNMTFTATYSSEYIEYTVSFYDEDGTLISSVTYHYGDEVVLPADPTKASDEVYGYTFDGWDKDVVVVAGDASYTATYKATYIEYTVNFYDEDGTLISSATYHYGDEIVAPNDPSKDADLTYTYTFDGWDNEVDKVTGHMNFTATYKATYIEYTVNFYDEDGTLISSETYHYGDEIVVPDDPSKDADLTYTYTFSGWDSEVGTVTGNMTFTATYSSEYIEYTVSFYDEDGTLISSVTYHYGDEVVLPADPTKASDEVYGYTFDGWDKDVVVVAGDASYTATYKATYIEYTVNFYDEDGTLISSATYHYGDEIVAPNDPSKDADLTYTYTFDGWDNEVDKVTGHMNFTATYKATYIEYTVNFYDEDGTLISSETYHYGDEIVVPDHPSKDADLTYTYTFSGWDSEVGTVTGNMTFTATYSSEYIEYTVSFYDEDGTLISSVTYHYGDEVVLPADPTKASDEVYGYTFDGWDKDVVVVAGDASYTATYKATYIEYTVNFYDEDGTLISSETYHYGDEIVAPNDPSKDADLTYTYTFDGWDNEVDKVTGHMNFTATYKATYIEYTVNFYDEDGTLISSETYHYGDEIVVPDHPSKDADLTYTYTFSGWDSEVGTVTGNMTFTATYSSEYIEYTVSFYDEDGTLISSVTYHYGDEVVLPADPTKASDEVYGYTFDGWDKDVVVVAGDASYTATYKATYIEYTVNFYDEDGTLISSETYHYGDEVVLPEEPTKASDEVYDYTFSGWDKDVVVVTSDASYTATYNKQFSEQYLSNLLKEELLTEIEDALGNVDLATYSTIKDIQTKMDGLTKEDKVVVEDALNNLIKAYENYVKEINEEFAETSEIERNFFIPITSSVGLFSLLGP